MVLVGFNGCVEPNNKDNKPEPMKVLSQQTRTDHFCYFSNLANFTGRSKIMEPERMRLRKKDRVIALASKQNWLKKGFPAVSCKKIEKTARFDFLNALRGKDLLRKPAPEPKITGKGWKIGNPKSKSLQRKLDLGKSLWRSLPPREKYEKYRTISYDWKGKERPKVNLPLK